MRFPFGQCQCDHDGDGCEGPAALEVTRDGDRIRVCTRCNVSSDEDQQPLVTVDTKMAPFLAWDDFGAITLALTLTERGV